MRGLHRACCLLPGGRENSKGRSRISLPPCSSSSSPAGLLCPVLLTQKRKGQEAGRGVKSQVWKDESFNTMPQLWSQQQNLQVESFLEGVGSEAPRRGWHSHQGNSPVTHQLRQQILPKKHRQRTNPPHFLPVTPWSIRRSRAQRTGRIRMPGSRQQSRSSVGKRKKAEVSGRAPSCRWCCTCAGTEPSRGDVTSHWREDALSSLGFRASWHRQQQFGLSTSHSIPWDG